MAKGSKGMGIAKHRKSGRSGKSPKMRHHMKREAEKNVIKAPPPLPARSIKELFGRT